MDEFAAQVQTRLANESRLEVYYSLILERTSMVTQVVTDPFD
ncbi:MAG: hypothetical protein ACUVRV_05860 [Cyanobacteriota bacterium]